MTDTKQVTDEQIEDAKRAVATRSALIEMVTKAILFEECGSTEDWESNTNLGEAAVRVCDARNPPRCSHCHSSTSTPAYPSSAPEQSEDTQASVSDVGAGEAPGCGLGKFRLTWQEAEAVCVRDEVDEALREFSHDSTGDNAVGLVRCIVETWLRHPTPKPDQSALRAARKAQGGE